VSCDVADRNDVLAAIETVSRALGGVDILVKQTPPPDKGAADAHVVQDTAPEFIRSAPVLPSA
jgi:NAD(P)-dependent dehydrogenase (short-subunit alcohol dehydrogenase family)